MKKYKSIGNNSKRFYTRDSLQDKSEMHLPTFFRCRFLWDNRIRWIVLYTFPNVNETVRPCYRQNERQGLKQVRLRLFFFNYELATGKQLGNSSRFCLAGVIESEAIGWKSNFPSSLLDFLSPKGTLSTKVRSSVSFPSFSFPFPKQTSIGRFLFSRCVLRVSRIIIEGDSEARIPDTASTKGTLYSSVS